MGSEDSRTPASFRQRTRPRSQPGTSTGASELVRARPSPRWTPAKSKRIHELFALLNKIYSARLTGQLQLVLGRVERQLFFDGGQLVFATSSDRQDSLGEMMLREGAITQSQFEEAAELVKTGQRFGSAIAEMGILSPSTKSSAGSSAS